MEIQGTITCKITPLSDVSYAYPRFYILVLTLICYWLHADNLLETLELIYLPFRFCLLRNLLLFESKRRSLLENLV